MLRTGLFHRKFRFGAIMAALGIVAASLGCSKSESSQPGVVEHFTGKTTVDAGQTAKRSLAQSNLELAVNRYKAVRGELPNGLDDLVEEGLLQSSALEDEWGSSLTGTLEDGTFVVRSPGVDRQPGTADDWTLSFR